MVTFASVMESKAWLSFRERAGHISLTAYSCSSDETANRLFFTKQHGKELQEFDFPKAKRRLESAALAHRAIVWDKKRDIHVVEKLWLLMPASRRKFWYDLYIAEVLDLIDADAEV